jgi:lysophospholipase L1-like esterase
VAAELNLKLTDVSCGGATTQQVRRSQTIGPFQVPPQLEALTPETDLVTLSLGANDFDTFLSIVVNCTALRSHDPDGAPCEADASHGLSATTRNMATIEARLVSAIRHLATRAPKARIVIVGYPEFFPESGPCAQLPLALGDYAFAHRVNELLVRAQKQAAERAKVEYVDVYTPTRGHNMCSDEPWIAGISPQRPDAILYHPYPEEQQLVARLLIDHIT